MQTTATFDKLLAAWVKNPRYIDSAGGTRSGKTYAALQLLSLICPNDASPTISSVVSETGPHLSRGAIRDFKAIMAEDGRWDERAWNKTQSVYTFPNGSILEFFSADQPGKVLGPARDRLFINEANNISYDVARQLIVRTSGKVLWDYNPVHAFWAHEHYAPRENCISIHSTYLDNGFLTPEQVAEIESYKTDKNWWRVYGLGLVGELEGTIYDFEQIDEMPTASNLVDIYGMDFGFTNDPTALIHLRVDTARKIIYAEQLVYETALLNRDIVERMEALGVPKRSVPIYADCAEPKSIAEISRAGFNVKPCQKDAPVRSEKMKFQIDFVKGYQLRILKSSTDLIKELRNYTWAKDKDGNNLNVPIDKWNHALDALRYAIYTHFAKEYNYGNYNFSIR